MGYDVGPKLNINKKELREEIVKSKENDKLTPNALKSLIEIANHAINRLPYNNPIDREDCIQSALYDLMKYWRNYNPEISDNAFAFYTQMAKNGYAKVFNVIHKNKKLKSLKVFKPSNSFYDLKSLKYSLLDYYDTNIKEQFLDNNTSNFRYDVPDNLVENYFRYSGNKKKWSAWSKFDIMEMEPDFDEIFSHEDNNTIDAYFFEFKFEFKTNIDFVSLDQLGESEIYSI